MMFGSKMRKVLIYFEYFVTRKRKKIKLRKQGMYLREASSYLEDHVEEGEVLQHSSHLVSVWCELQWNLPIAL